MSAYGNVFPVTTIALAIAFASTLLYSNEKLRKSIHAVPVMLLLLPTITVILEWAHFGFDSIIYEKPFISSLSIGSFSMAIDYVSAPIAITIGIVTSIIAFYSKKYMTKRIEELGIKDANKELPKYYVLYTLFSASMMGVALSTNLVEFYMFLEIGLVSSFLLIDYYGYGDRRRIALLYLVWTHVGAVSFMLGAIIYGLSSSTFDYILVSSTSKGVLVGWGEAYGTIAMVKWAFYLMLFGLLVKTAAFGVHLWLPYAHAEAPTPVSALLSPLLIGLGPFAMIRFLAPLFPEVFSETRLFLASLAILTIIYGGLTALYESDVKRFLAYSSISQMGYLLLGASTMTTIGVAGVVIHYIAHALSKATLFGSAGSIIYHYDGERRINKMSGFASTIPYTAAASLIGFLGISGIPPSLGFWGELMIIRGYTEYVVSSLSHPLAYIVLAFTGFSLTLAYSFRNYRRIFYGKPRENRGIKGVEEKGISVPLLILSSLILLLFIIGPSLGSGVTAYIGGMLR
jgi:formate hydrogenlyase subunit 3/multisubunit Na+/H+ antiporter MnhD subunit